MAVAEEPGSSPARERWFVAGQELLREGGVKAVKIHALLARTGLTSGSFYHHFSGMGPYLVELAAHYGAGQSDELLASLASRPPAERLAGLIEVAAASARRPLDRAMRDWAGIDASAAAAVREADERLLHFVADALIEAGLDEDDARVRATLLVSMGVARLHLPWPLPSDAAERIVRLIRQV